LFSYKNFDDFMEKKQTFYPGAGDLLALPKTGMED